MTTLIFLIEQLATGLYILIGVGLLLALRALARAQAELRATHFELEREIALYARKNALTTLLLLIEAGLIVLGVQRVAAPYLRDTFDVTIAIAQVQSDGEFRTPTPQPVTGGIVIDASGVQLGEQDPAQLIIATPTLTPTPVGTIVPNSPAPIGCDTPGATLQIPANGMIVFEPLVVRGTANTDNFAYYKFELNGPATFGNFAPLAQYTSPVPEPGALGQFVPAPYEPGRYQFRVIVFDITNTPRASCTITIFISEPIPTPTPLGTAPSGR